MNTDPDPNHLSLMLFCPGAQTVPVGPSNYVVNLLFWYAARVWESEPEPRQMRLAPEFALPESLQVPFNDPDLWESFRFSAMYAAMNLISGYDGRQPEVVWREERQGLPLPPVYLIGYDLLPTRLASFPLPLSVGPPTIGAIHTRPPWWAVLVPQADRRPERVRFLVPGEPAEVTDGARDAALRQALQLLQSAP